MDIQVKKGIRPEGNVLSFAEEKAIRERVQDLENDVAGTEIQQGLAYQPRNPELAQKKLSHFKGLLSSMSASRLEGKDREHAEIEIRRLEQKMGQKWGGQFPSYDEYWMNSRTGGIRYLRLRDTIIKVQADREYGELMRRWKYLKRRMEPQDSNADNVLQLFDRRR